jgi:hypothetical protein
MTTDLVFSFILDDNLLDYGDSDLEINGQSDDMVALRYAYQIVPPARITINSNLQKQICMLDQLNLDQIGPKEYKVKATYKVDVNRGVGQSGSTQRYGTDPNVLPFIRIDFNIGGGTKKITTSLQVRQTDLSTSSPLPLPPGNVERAIGMSEDGIEGTEVASAELRLQVTAYYNPAFITLDFIKTVRDTIAGPSNQGTYNDDVFLGFESGEVQLRTANGGGTVVDIIPITYDFAIGKNRVGATDAGFPTLTAKGHDYIDYVYFARIDPDAKRTLQKPDVRYIHRLHDEVDYSLLRIPQP